MNKKIIGIFVVLCLVAPVAHAQTVDLSTMTRPQLLAYLDSLIQQLLVLEQELNAMENASSSVPVVSAPVQPEIAATSTDIGAGLGTATVQPVEVASVIVTPAPMVKTQVPFDSIVPRMKLNVGIHDVYFNIYSTSTPFNVTIQLNGKTLNDPAYGQDGLGLNLHDGALTGGTSYDYSIHIEGVDWQTDSTGSFTTNQ